MIEIHGFEPVTPSAVEVRVSKQSLTDYHRVGHWMKCSNCGVQAQSFTKGNHQLLQTDEGRRV